jgi:hypothetical protein
VQAEWAKFTLPRTLASIEPSRSKFLPHLSSPPEFKQRMDREAGAISCLNHPNVYHLYDIGSQDAW